MMHIGKVLVYRLLATFPESQALNQRRRRAKQLCYKGCYWVSKSQLLGRLKIALQVNQF
jgi:hypothetical protein